MVKSYPKLTQALVASPVYINRKKPGRISFIVYTPLGDIYPVPVNEEHIDFFKRILLPNIPKENFGIYVPADIDLELTGSGLYIVKNTRIGVSGLEIRLGIKHKKADLELAAIILKAFVENGEIKVQGELKQEMVYRHTCD
ncbi:hypothetical protein J4427_02970 [Candidatus Woesearchaeota archaeon]|nr:hypothetical protein [Candidatus Woesearchaeota archaeon]